MYVGDIKFNKGGLISKIDVRKPGKEDVSASISCSSLATFSAITVALLTFTVGYAVVNQEVKGKSSFKIPLILILISTISYLFTLEAQETSFTVQWEETRKKKFNRFIRWVQIIGWHTLFLYLFSIISLIDNTIFFVTIVASSIILFYYYCCLVD